MKTFIKIAQILETSKALKGVCFDLGRWGIWFSLTGYRQGGFTHCDRFDGAGVWGLKSQDGAVESDSIAESEGAFD